jgi:hypothetical protein
VGCFGNQNTHHPSPLLVNENTTTFFQALKKTCSVVHRIIQTCVLSLLQVLQLRCSTTGILPSFLIAIYSSDVFCLWYPLFYRFMFTDSLFSDSFALIIENITSNSKEYLYDISNRRFIVLSFMYFLGTWVWPFHICFFFPQLRFILRKIISLVLYFLQW